MLGSMPIAFKAMFRTLLGILPDKWAIQLMHYRRFRRLPNLRAPQTLSEKVNWRKLYQRDPRFTVFVDKVAVKEEIARLVGREHVIPTLWTGERPEDIPFDDISPPYVIKVNHGIGHHIFIRRRDDIDAKKIRAVLKKQLRHSYGRDTRQWAYADIPRRILIERMLEIGGEIPEDYKFFVYHGRVHFIQVEVNRFTRHEAVFFDRTWTELPGTKNVPNSGKLISKPSHLEGMIAVAEKIGTLFDFVSVDLYCVSGTVLFGETTFYPGGVYLRMGPAEWDLMFGEPWLIDKADPPAR